MENSNQISSQELKEVIKEVVREEIKPELDKMKKTQHLKEGYQYLNE